MMQITAKELDQLQELAERSAKFRLPFKCRPEIALALIAAYRERGRLLGFLARIAEYDFQGNPSNDAAVVLEESKS